MHEMSRILCVDDHNHSKTGSGVDPCFHDHREMLSLHRLDSDTVAHVHLIQAKLLEIKIVIHLQQWKALVITGLIELLLFHI